MKDLIKNLLGLNKTEASKYATFERNIDANKHLEKTFKKNPSLKKLADNYILLTNSHLSGKPKEIYSAKLKQDIAEYSENHPELVADKADAMAKIAYFRLQKASKQYCLQKLYEENKELIEHLKQEAKNYSMEYELTACLR